MQFRPLALSCILYPMPGLVSLPDSLFRIVSTPQATFGSPMVDSACVIRQEKRHQKRETYLLPGFQWVPTHVVTSLSTDLV